MSSYQIIRISGQSANTEVLDIKLVGTTLHGIATSDNYYVYYFICDFAGNYSVKKILSNTNSPSLVYTAVFAGTKTEAWGSSTL
jgi:hypothetical protein